MCHLGSDNPEPINLNLKERHPMNFYVYPCDCLESNGAFTIVIPVGKGLKRKDVLDKERNIVDCCKSVRNMS